MSKLVGSQEIADLLGVSRQRVHQWHRDLPDFPQPAHVLNMGRLWYWPDVERWARDTGRLPED